jgi:hypothetical protein
MDLQFQILPAKLKIRRLAQHLEIKDTLQLSNLPDTLGKREQARAALLNKYKISQDYRGFMLQSTLLSRSADPDPLIIKYVTECFPEGDLRQALKSLEQGFRPWFLAQARIS